VDCSQTKQIVPSMDNGVVQYCMGQNRKRLRMLTQIVTGHSTLNGHLRKMGLSHTSICIRCGKEVETRNHFLGDCEASCEARLKIFGKPFLAADEVTNLPLRGLMEFIISTNRLNSITQGK
jgi:hypothetical protein